MTLPATVCLQCGAVNDIKFEDGPQPGEFALCSYCKHVMVFNNDLQWRSLTREEKEEWDKIVQSMINERRSK